MKSSRDFLKLVSVLAGLFVAICLLSTSVAPPSKPVSVSSALNSFVDSLSAAYNRQFSQTVAVPTQTPKKSLSDIVSEGRLSSTVRPSPAPTEDTRGTFQKYIDEKYGSSSSSTSRSSLPKSPSYIGNRNSMVFHKPSCSSVRQMKESNKVSLYSRSEAIDEGYRPCRRCNP